MVEDSLLSLFASALNGKLPKIEPEGTVLEQVDRQLWAVFEHAPIGFALFEPDFPFRVLFHNTLYQSLCPEPFNKDSVVGKALTEYVPNAEEEGILDIYREVVRTKQSKTLYKMVYLHPTRGQTVWNWSLTPILAEGEVTMLAHVLVDVTEEARRQQQLETEQQRVTNELHASDVKMKLILRETKTSIYTTDTDLKYAWIYNPHPDFRAEDMIGKRDEELLPLESVKELIDLKQQVLKTGKGAQKRISTVIHGEMSVFLVTVELLRDQQDVLQGLVVVTTDVTESERTQIALQQAEEKFRVTLMNSPLTVAQVGRDLRYTWIYNPPSGFKAEDLIGKRVDELSLGTGSDQLLALKQRVLDNSAGERERIAFEIAGSVRVYDVTAEPLIDEDGNTIGVTTASIDVTEQERIEARNHVLRDLAVSLASVTTQQEIAEAILQKVTHDLGAAGGTIAILSKDESHLRIVGAAGYSQQVIEKWASIPLDHPTAPIALAARENKAFWLRTPKEREQTIPATPQLTEEEQHQAWAVLPLSADDELLGVIGLGFDIHQEFSEKERAFYITLAGYCAQALKRAQLTEKVRDLAQLEERQRLARDLHDSVKQILFASSIIAEALQRKWNQSPDQAEVYTNELVHLNRTALAELQTLLLGLRPEMIVQTPFNNLVEDLHTGLRGQKTIDVNFVYEGPEELYLPADIQVECYHLVQEAFNNIAKHSEASRVDIECRFDSIHFRLTIRDNGKGFDLKHISSGMGLNTMRERAKKIGALFDIHSTPGNGTQIMVEWKQ